MSRRKCRRNQSTTTTNRKLNPETEIVRKCQRRRFGESISTFPKRGVTTTWILKHLCLLLGIRRRFRSRSSLLLLVRQPQCSHGTRMDASSCDFQSTIRSQLQQ
uniref:(northern house mosquito) hypothetical protein n=1 Tax=Culex pipiens TaxID=7175 RepID=A0A8D8C1T9_CULPI